jgi:hypothetical protein
VKHQEEVMSTDTIRLPIKKLRTDGGTQARERLDEGHLRDLSHALDQGDQLPPLDAVSDGSTYWLWDGFHRLETYRRRMEEEVDVRVTRGTLRDAVLLAVAANRAHGLKRSIADRRRAVTLLLADKEWKRRTVHWIAEACGVSDDLVASVQSAQGRVPGPRTSKDGRYFGKERPNQPKRREPQPRKYRRPEEVNRGKNRYEFSGVVAAVKATITALEHVVHNNAEKVSLEYQACRRLIDELLKKLHAWEKRVKGNKESA